MSETEDSQHLGNFSGICTLIQHGLKCPVCHDLILEKCCLDCGHTICSLCLNNCLDISIVCPVCRANEWPFFCALQKTNLHSNDHHLLNLIAIVVQHDQHQSRKGLNNLNKESETDNRISNCNCNDDPKCRYDQFRRCRLCELSIPAKRYKRGTENMTKPCGASRFRTLLHSTKIFFMERVPIASVVINWMYPQMSEKLPNNVNRQCVDRPVQNSSSSIVIPIHRRRYWYIHSETSRKEIVTAIIVVILFILSFCLFGYYCFSSRRICGINIMTWILTVLVGFLTVNSTYYL